MSLVARGEVLGTTNPKLQFWLTYNDIKVALSSLEFIVYDVSTPTNQANPVQVYPSSGRATVNLSTDVLYGGYVASFTMPATGPAGLYQIRWFFKRTSASNERVYKFEFWAT